MASPSPSSTVNGSKDFANSLVEKYTTDFPVHQPLLPQQPPPTLFDTVLLVGSRGGIGANLLSQLLRRHCVRKVYALNRNHDDGRTSQERQRDEFRLQGLDPSLAGSEKLVLLEGKTSHATLGLARDIFDEISKSVTAIIVNGWRVEFHSPLSEFEDLIYGIRNLINIALRSPQSQSPYFLFCSSLALLQDLDIPSPIPETFLEDAPPVGVSGEGYRRSKWVVESIIKDAMKKSALRASVARIGQISGSINGYWKTDEWFPIMVKSSQYLGCLPMEDRWTAWISAPLAASTIIDLMGSNIPVCHIVHSHPVPFTSILQPLSKLLNVELVSRTEWFRRLESSTSPDLTKEEKKANPAVRMPSFFRMCMTKSYQGAFNLPIVRSVEAEKGSESLRRAKERPTDEEDVRRWVDYWQKMEFLDRVRGDGSGNRLKAKL